jgi:short-subunit dehydrogenase
MSNKTILITGCSSGIGLATAQLFSSKDWNVIATMRSPEKEVALSKLKNVYLIPLDVTDPRSIQSAIRDGQVRFGKIDVIVNNAGFALAGPFECADESMIKNQFDTNVMGLFSCIKAILPHFRENKSGTIINVASMGGRVCFPYFSLYHSTKWAVDGFSESLQYELKNFGIKVKIIEPGAIKTEFYKGSRLTIENFDAKDELTKAYGPHYKLMKNEFDKAGEYGSNSEIVAHQIYRAANDNSNKLRYTVGLDAKLVLFIKWFLPNRIFFWLMQALNNNITKTESK